ncbi:LysR family transcriptional regulator [Pelomicrobium sp. G1]|uniref:LysR family transcriptional regulator n=1 Tax=unclassified Pelomicrobium TaxID=2815318 RepID=UPI003F76488E
MKNATLRQLTIFETVARQLNFTRAAKELGVTQAAVSIQIKQLEENLGIALFEQLGKRIYLTEAGQELYRYCRHINLQLAEAETVLDRLKESKGGQLKLAIGGAAKYFVPILLAAFRRRWEGFSVTLNVASREMLLAQLADNACDMAIMSVPPEGDDLVAEPFLEDPLVPIAPPDHPLSRERAVPLSRLVQEPFLTYEQGSETREAIEHFFARQGIAVSASMAVNSNEAIKRGVQAGLGLAIVPIHSVTLEIEVGRLIVLDVVSMPLHRSWYLIHRQGKRFSLVAEAFKEFVLQEARGCVLASPGKGGQSVALQVEEARADLAERGMPSCRWSI